MMGPVRVEISCPMDSQGTTTMDCYKIKKILTRAFFGILSKTKGLVCLSRQRRVPRPTSGGGLDFQVGHLECSSNSEEGIKKYSSMGALIMGGGGGGMRSERRRSRSETGLKMPR